MITQPALTHWHALAAGQIATTLESDSETGLTPAEAAARLRQFGPSQMTAQKHLSEWRRFVLQLHQPLIYILLASTGIAAAMGEWVDAAESQTSAKSETNSNP